MRVIWLRLVFLVFFLTAASDTHDKAYYYINQDKAREMLKTRCKYFNPETDLFTNDAECKAVTDALEEHRQQKERAVLIRQLEKMQTSLSKGFTKKDMESERYKEFTDVFEKNNVQAEDFIGACLGEHERVAYNGLECLAATNVLLEHFKRIDEAEAERREKEINYEDYYRQYFRENPKKAEEILKGRCQKVFANRWYEYDIELQDQECNVARTESLRRQRLEKFAEVEKKKSEIKDIAYYREHSDESRKTAEDCRNGTIENLDNCDVSMQFLKEEDANTREKERLQLYYKDHILAAQFYLHWCKSSMKVFDMKCQVVQNTLKNHQDKVLDEAKIKQYTDFYTENPFEAKLTVGGECYERLNDSWYHLDINLKTEKCDAASSIAK